MTMQTILAVEDSPTQAETLRTRLADAGYRVEVATTGADALDRLAEIDVDLVLSTS